MIQYRIRFIAIVIACLLALGCFAAQSLFSAEKTKYIILVRYTLIGFERHVVYKLTDFFRMNYPGDSKLHKIWHLKSGEYIKSKDKTGPLYVIESSYKVAGKNEMWITVRPYITPDPRSIYMKK